jgi:hypothetical protein
MLVFRLEISPGNRGRKRDARQIAVLRRVESRVRGIDGESPRGGLVRAGRGRWCTGRGRVAARGPGARSSRRQGAQPGRADREATRWLGCCVRGGGPSVWRNRYAMADLRREVKPFKVNLARTIARLASYRNHTKYSSTELGRSAPLCTQRAGAEREASRGANQGRRRADAQREGPRGANQRQAAGGLRELWKKVQAGREEARKAGGRTEPAVGSGRNATELAHGQTRGPHYQRAGKYFGGQRLHAVDEPRRLDHGAPLVGV